MVRSRAQRAAGFQWLVRKVRCPRCGAASYTVCYGEVGSGNHPERIRAFRDQQPSSRELSRRLVREVDCPRCGACPGENCVEDRGRERVSNHMERVHAARERLSVTLV
jgi:transcription elongation factor Elf1